MKNPMETALQVVQASIEVAPGYEAPHIESVLTPEALEREVHYAGTTPVSGGATA